MSRQGKHRYDKYRVQAYYEVQDKALIVLVAKIDGASLTDTIMSSIRDRAKALGILDADGKISNEYRDALEMEASIIKQADNRQKGTQA